MGIKHAAIILLLVWGAVSAFAQPLPPEAHGGNYNLTFDILTPEDGMAYRPVLYDYTKFSPQYRPQTAGELQRKCLVHDGAQPFGFEKWLAREAATSRLLYRKDNSAYIIPVVIHVVYSSPDENISEAQVLSQIQVLNEDYRRKNADTSKTRPAFRRLTGDPKIEFRLAQVSPQGRPTNGIDRIPMFGAPFDDKFINSIIKPNTSWDPSKYLNIWVVNIANGVLGYSQFPDAPRVEGIPDSVGDQSTDGVVISYRCFGTLGTAQAPFNKGRTATHEIGHWLGLRHTWGDGTDCTASDYCGDTPPVSFANFGCINAVNGCNGTLAMVENFMDYTDDSCMNAFTSDQVIRMRAVLENSPRRMSLVSSKTWMKPPPGAVPPAVDTLGFCDRAPLIPPMCLNFNGSGYCGDTSYVFDPDHDMGWTREKGYMTMRNFDNLRRNSMDWLVLPPLDLSDTTLQYALSFDVAYSIFSDQYTDTLAVLVALDCDSEFEAIYFKGGKRLATSANEQLPFSPTRSDWRTEAIDLSDFAGEETVQIAFVNLSGYGNNLYLDNILIDKQKPAERE